MILRRGTCAGNASVVLSIGSIVHAWLYTKITYGRRKVLAVQKRIDKTALACLALACQFAHDGVHIAITGPRVSNETDLPGPWSAILARCRGLTIKPRDNGVFISMKPTTRKCVCKLLSQAFRLCKRYLEACIVER